MFRILTYGFIFLALSTIAHIAGVASASPIQDSAVRGYPPYGFPCLGCYPCPPSYCDLNTLRVVPGNGSVGGTPAMDKKKADLAKRASASYRSDTAFARRVTALPGTIASPNMPGGTAIVICQTSGKRGMCHDTNSGHGFAWGEDGTIKAVW